jgi:hypothetical protein
MTTEFSNTRTLDEPATGSEQSPLAEAGQRATESAGQLAGRAADIGLQQADRGREVAAESIDKLARSVRRVSTDMQTDQPQIANAAITAADQATRVAEYLRTTDTREMISTVEDAARRQPLLFVGGAFVLGVVVSRFIKAAGSAGQSAGQFRRSGPGTDYRGSDSFQVAGTGKRNGNEGF